MSHPSSDAENDWVLNAARSLLGLGPDPFLDHPFLLDLEDHECIHESGNSVVFKGRNTQFGRMEVVKFTRRDLALTEAVLTGRLTGHDGIVAIYGLDLDRAGGLAVLRSACVPGATTLAAEARETEHLRTPFGAAACALRIAEALNYVHGQGIAHLDLKPDNILYNTITGRPVLIDFGLAVDQQAPVMGGRGTEGFRAPEVANGKGDAQSDLFSLGAILYFMTQGLDAPASAPTFRSDTDAELRGLMDHLLQPKPVDRPKSADLVARRLSRIVAGADHALHGSIRFFVDGQEVNDSKSCPVNAEVKVSLEIDLDDGKAYFYWLCIGNDGNSVLTRPQLDEIGHWSPKKKNLGPGHANNFESKKPENRDHLIAVASSERLANLERHYSSYEHAPITTKGSTGPVVEAKKDRFDRECDRVFEILRESRRQGISVLSKRISLHWH
ncbi:MAG: serine/threonine-protein kinase [Planctomycetota bacterium]